MTNDELKWLVRKVLNRVWCKTCKRSQEVDPVLCLRKGWPKCCGHTMTLDSPEKRYGER